MKRRTTLKTGDLVQMKQSTIDHLSKVNLTTDHDFATVRVVLEGDYGGICLDRPLYGFRYWNSDDLELVENKDV